MLDLESEQLKFDEKLMQWVAQTLPGTSISLEPPAKQGDESAVGLYLMEVAQTPTPSTGTRPPLRLMLKYLVTVRDQSPEKAHGKLVQLMLAAMETTEYEVDAEPLPLTVWGAFGVVPRPCFLLRVPVSFEREQKKARPVSKPLQVRWSDAAPLYGIVEGPGDAVLSNCRIEIPALNIATTTDYAGKFFFSSVPDGDKEVVVKARGCQLRVRSGVAAHDITNPLRIQFSPSEE